MEQIAEEVHKPSMKPRQYRKVVVYFPNDIWSADIVEMNSEGMPEQNEGYKYILVVIDIFTRYAWTRKLKNKTGLDTAKALKSIINETKAKPEGLWVDQGKEFYNKNVKDTMKDTKIYSTYGEGKAAYVERLNRTLKNMMYKQFTINMNRNWISILDKITKKYNNQNHSAIGTTPNKLYNSDIDIPVNIEPSDDNKPKFKVGDRVRISYKRRPTFDKAYLPNWTWEIFTISKVNKSSPITYKIKDYEGDEISGSFYESELQLTKQKEDYYLIEKILDHKTVNKKKYSLVKWLGYDKPSWELTSQIKDFDFLK
jgi:hypothetical protein